MKYGDTLRQRSIPEWGHCEYRRRICQQGRFLANRCARADNIDYDYLKELIKHQTTPGTNKAVSIPGQGESTERAFGDIFFKVLAEQHDRINLFIRSKSGEIERRLEHISKTLQQLRTKRDPTSGRLPARTVERYAKIEADVIRYATSTLTRTRLHGHTTNTTAAPAKRSGHYPASKLPNEPGLSRS